MRHVLHSMKVGFDERLIVVCTVATGFGRTCGFFGTGDDFGSSSSLGPSILAVSRRSLVLRVLGLKPFLKPGLSMTRYSSLWSVESSVVSDEGYMGVLGLSLSRRGSFVFRETGGGDGGVLISLSDPDSRSEDSVAELERHGLK